MVVIQKSKDIRIKFTWFAFLAVALLTSLCYFLGWKLELNSFLVYVAFIVSEFLLLWLFCLILIKIEKSRYYIDDTNIRLVKNQQEILSIKLRNIISIRYVRFFWIFLMQFGSCYLNIIYKNENSEDTNLSTLLPTGEKVHSISMSLKQALKVSQLLGIELEIK